MDSVPYPGMAEWPPMSPQRAVEFFWAKNGTGIDGWHWLIEWSTSSFYIKSMNPALEGAKVSIHGPDPKHPGKQHLRFDRESDPKLIEKAMEAGGRFLTDAEDGPTYFTGREVRKDAGHIVRFCVEREPFVGDAPPAGGSRWPKEKTKAGRVILPVPREGHVAYFDVYLSFDKPYWPDEERVRATQSGLGPITNALGMHLTLVSDTSVPNPELNPCGDLRGDAPVGECLRGLTVGVDGDGVLWLCEQLISPDIADAVPRHY